LSMEILMTSNILKVLLGKLGFVRDNSTMGTIQILPLFG